MTNTGATTAGQPGENVSRKVVYFPLLLVETYLAVSVLLFAFGPWPWRVADPFALYTFLVLAQAFLGIGYWLGANKRNVTGVTGKKPDVARIIRISLYANCLWIVPKFILRTKLQDFSLDAIIGQIAFGLTDPASAHAATGDFSVNGTFNLIYVLFTPLLYLGLPLTIYNWKSVGKRVKILFFLVIFADILSWASTGTSKGIIDLAIIFLSVIAPVMALKWGKYRFRHKAALLVVVMALIVGAMGFFQAMQFSRRGENISTYDRHFNMYMDEENILVQGMSLEYKAGVGYFLNYLNQGYYALSLAVQEPFTFSWGLGNSMFWSSICNAVTGYNPAADSYPAKLEKYGVDQLVNWHTFYAWFASDLTFPGVVVLMAFLGYYFALSWTSTMKKENPYSVVIFSLFVMMILYIPANNQVLDFTPTAFAFPVIFGKWLKSGA